MRNDPYTAIVDPILKLLNQALPTDLASSVGSQIEATAQRLQANGLSTKARI